MFNDPATAIQQPKYGRPLPAWIKEAIAVQENRPLSKRQGGGGGGGSTSGGSDSSAGGGNGTYIP